MRLMAYEVDGVRRTWLRDGPRWADLGALALEELLGTPDGGRARLAAAAAAATPDGGPSPDAPLLAPLAHPSKMLFAGVNYRDHVEEAGDDVQPPPGAPLVFAKLPSAILAPGAPIVVPAGTKGHVDYEAELAVVIGRRCRHVPVEQALDHVLGYTIVNDVTERDIQLAQGQLMLGKGIDTFCPMGPAVVLTDEITDPGNLAIWTTVNGEERQRSNTNMLLFGVREIIAFLSGLVTLEPGDLIATGTPAGVGAFRTPPTWLAPGDVVTVGVDGIGALTNPVAAPSPG